MLEKKDIDHLTELARLFVPEEEKDALVKDLQAILAYVSELNAVTADTGAAPEAGALRNVMREDDIPTPGGTYTEAILANAPKVENGYVKVRAIF